jgi:hypothetical protein
MEALESSAERDQHVRLDRTPAAREVVDRDAARPQHARDLGQRDAWIEHVLHDRRRVDEVELAVCEWQDVVRRFHAPQELVLHRALRVREVCWSTPSAS